MGDRVDAGGAFLLLFGLVGWLGASVLYRLFRRKPVLFFTVAGSQYLEHGASGGAARNCLVIAIASGRLIIRPLFPFNLLFMPEIYDLEIDVPLENVVSAEILPAGSSMLTRLFSIGRNVQLSIRKPRHGMSSVRLRLADPETFVKLLSRQAQV